MTIKNLFSTPIKIISLSNYKEINTICKKSMNAGFKKNFFENLNDEDIIKTVGLFIKETELYYNESTNQNVNVSITKSWFSHHNKYNWNTPHGHSSAFIVGVYYVETNDDAGDLLLLDPRGTVKFNQLYDKDSKNETVGSRCYFKIKPKTGDLILFPAYIVHSVEPNLSDKTRISLAMNFDYKDFTQFKPD